MGLTIVGKHSYIEPSMKIMKVWLAFSFEGNDLSNGNSSSTFEILYRLSLFFSGCDINSSRRVGLNGEKPDICKTLESPLHLG
jgi:hypothetical protein